MSFGATLRRLLPSRPDRATAPADDLGRGRRPRRPCRRQRCRRRALGAARAACPRPRTEVAAALAGDRIVVVGGFVSTTARTPRAPTSYSIRGRPLAAAARPAGRGRPRGRGELGGPRLRRRRLRRRPAPAPRRRSCSSAAAGAALAGSAGGARGAAAAVVGGRLYVVGGVDERAGSRASRSCSTSHRPLVAHARPRPAARAPRRSGREGPRLRGRRPQRRLRHEHASVRVVRPGDAALDRLSAPPVGPRRHRRDGRRRPDRLRRRRGSRPARSRASTPTTCAHGAGGGSPICPRRATGSASSPTATASTPSRAGRSRA